MIIVPPCGLSLSCDLKLQHVAPPFLTVECSNNFHISASSLLSLGSWRHMVSVIPGFIWHLPDLDWNLFHLFHSVLSDSGPYISLNWALGFFRWERKDSQSFTCLSRACEERRKRPDVARGGRGGMMFWSYSGISSLLVKPYFTAGFELLKQG